MLLLLLLLLLSALIGASLHFADWSALNTVTLALAPWRIITDPDPDPDPDPDLNPDLNPDPDPDPDPIVNH